MMLAPALLLSLALQAGAGSNPIMPGADPHAMFAGGQCWIYPTRSPAGGQGFLAFSSKDMKTWTQHGPVLRFADVKWIKDDGATSHYAWAPGVAERKGKFYFYYSVGPQGPTPSRIGVAVGSRPEGPFVDSGKPLLTGGKGFEAIDPMVFGDPQTGRYYLYAGGSAGAKLRVFEMADNMINFRREVTVKTPPKFTEGAFMHYRDGVYYLSYSHGGWRDPSYSVHYATSNSPTGPWRYRGAILTSDAHHKGPGHHSILQRPGTDDWYIVYHRWDNAPDTGPYRGQRQIAIEPLHHEYGTWIRPVKMTD